MNEINFGRNVKTPRHYQEAAIHMGVETNCLVCDDPGLGKTLTAIEIAVRRRAYLAPEAKQRVLVICPKRVKDQWVAEINSQDPSAHKIYRVDSVADADIEKARTTLAGERFVWVLTHYDIVAKPPVLEFLRSGAWDTLICDEAHRLGNRKNQWTKAIKLIRAERKVGLTGTPQEKSAANLWSLLNWIKPGTFSSYWKFHNEFVDTVPTWPGSPYSKVVGTKNADELARWIAPIFLRRTKEQVAPELPPNIIQPVALDMDPEQRVLYSQIRDADDILVELPPANADASATHLMLTNKLTRIVRLQQVSSLPSLLYETDPPIPSPKLEWVQEWIADNPDQPVIIFSKFRGVIQYIGKKLGKRCVTLLGGSGRSGETNLNAFLEGRVNVLAGTIAAMSEGLNLQRAETAIFVDAEWSSRLMNQAVNRIHRMNITTPRLTYQLYHRRSVDELVLDALENKWSDQEMVLQALRRVQEGSM